MHVTGDNKYGQLGDGSTVSKNVFTSFIFGRARTIAAGYGHSIVSKQGGNLWVAGRNNYGQLGEGPKTFTSTFVEVISDDVQDLVFEY